MSNQDPSRSRNHGRRWRYGVIAVILLGLGGLAAVLYTNGSFAPSDDREQGAAATRQLWTCGMHPQVIRDRPGTCPICHMELTPLKASAPSGAAAGGERKIKYWWDPMIGPESISDKPGKSAMGMDLVPVYEDEAAAGDDAGAVVINPVVVQNMGVRTAEVTHGPLMTSIRAVGFLRPAEPNLHDVNLRLSGWIEELYADTEGMALEKGDPLFELYSPQLQTAVEELIASRGSLATTRDGSADELAAQTTATVYDAARRKLLLLGLDAAQVERLAAMESAPLTVMFNSPISGRLIEKAVVEGAAVREGERVMRIADLSTLWLDAEVFAQDLPFIEMGQPVVAGVEGLPGGQFQGHIIFVDPYVEAVTRTATVRIALPNPQQTLRPGMYATARIEAQLAGETLLVPREAVIDTGARQVVFLSMGSGRFAPRDVTLGASNRDGTVQVLEGLSRGDAVVTSGQFLLDAESRMREAIQKHLDERLLAGASPGQDQAPAGAPMSEATPPDRSAPSTRPGGAGEAPLEWSADVDVVFNEYLRLQRALGAAQPPAQPLDVANLLAAAQKLASVTVGDLKRLPQDVADAASAMRDKPLEEQRELFKKLSDAVIAMAEVCPPSTSVAPELYLFFCPMERAEWLQTTKQTANPYYATDMKACGDLKRTLTTVAE